MSNNKKERLAKKRRLEQMRKEIEGLEKQIKYSRFTNLKIGAIKDLKIFLAFDRLVAPYILTAGITFGLFSIMEGGTPIILDDIKTEHETKKVLDSNGNIHIEEQYGEYNGTATISYIGKWTSTGEGLYTREKKTYTIGSIDEAKIESLLEASDIKSLSDIFGKPISIKRETRNNLTEDDINSEAYIEATMYSKESNDYIIVKENAGDNLGVSLLWIFLTCLLEFIPATIRSKVSKFSFDSRIREISRDYQPIDTDELTKKLEIRRSNYNRLTR